MIEVVRKKKKNWCHFFFGRMFGEAGAGGGMTIYRFQAQEERRSPDRLAGVCGGVNAAKEEGANKRALSNEGGLRPMGRLVVLDANPNVRDMR